MRVAGNCDQGWGRRAQVLRRADGTEEVDTSVGSTTMDAAVFIAQLASENESILKRLAPAQALGVEAGGDLSPRNLLRVALKNELEASEIAALWMPSARGAELKLALARQAGDEARHYRLIVDRLHDLGDDLEGFDPLAQGYSPLFK